MSEGLSSLAKWDNSRYLQIYGANKHRNAHNLEDTNWELYQQLSTAKARIAELEKQVDELTKGKK